MSRSLAGVIAIALGLPILAMIALASIGAFNPQLLMTFLVGGAVMTFVVGAIFEIKRIADLDSKDDPHQAEILLTEALSEPKVYEAAPAIMNDASGPPPLQSAGLQTRPEATPVPGAIIVEPQVEQTAADTFPVRAASKRQSRKVSSKDAVPPQPEEAAPLAAKSRQRTGQRKPVRTA